MKAKPLDPEIMARLERAIAENPLGPALLLRASTVLEQPGDPLRVIECLEVARSLDPGSALGISLLATACLHAGRHAEAEQLFERSLEISPASHRFVLLGVAQRRQGREEDAISSFRRALEINPAFDEAMINLAMSLMAVAGSVPAEPESLLRRAIELDPSSAIAHRELGFLSARSGRPQEAMALLNNSIRLDPTDPWAHLYAAVALEDLQDVAGAEQRYLRAVELAPDWASPYGLTGRFYQRCRRWDDAERMFRKEISLAPESPVSTRHLAELLIERGQFWAGHKMLARSLRNQLNELKADLDEFA